MADMINLKAFNMVKTSANLGELYNNFGIDPLVR